VPVRGTGVSAAQALGAAELAAADWRRLGLVVDVAPVRASPVGSALGGTDDTLAFHLGRGAGTEAAVTAQVVGAPLVAAARGLGPAATPGTVLMLAVPTLVSPSSPARHWGLDLRGLTLGRGGLAPGALDAGGQPEPAAGLAGLGLPPLSGPIVFVDVGTPRRPGDVWTTPTHEVGHALGLSHREGGEAVLMRPGTAGQRCQPGLSPVESAAVGATLAGSAGAPVSDAPDEPEQRDTRERGAPDERERRTAHPSDPRR
jgi:hypothetical protein